MRLIHNARIHTLDPNNPLASVIVIDAGLIIAVGGEELLLEFQNADCEDMEGRIILPGLTDAHIHLQDYALSLQIVDCGVDSKEEILFRVAEQLQTTLPDKWLRGHGWNQNIWGGEWPTAMELDRLFPEIPVYLTAKSLHVAWVNTIALEMAGINSSSPDPVNGHIQRDVHGVPTGILFENAMMLVEKIIPEPPPETLSRDLKRVIPDLWRMGLTGVHDFDKCACFQALQLLQENYGLHFRVIKSIPYELLPQASAIGLRTGFGNDFLKIGSIKLFADGALGPHTGAMEKPYVDDLQNRGILILDSEHLFEIGQLSSKSGLSLSVHAIGDRAVHEVLDGFTRLRAYELAGRLPVLRHRIEHVQTIQPGDVKRLADLKIIASMQPIHAPSDMLMVDCLLGDRAAYYYAWRTYLNQGVRLAFGSDAPVESPNPFKGIHAAVTRCREDGSPGPNGWIPEQRLTIREAVEGFTIGPAYAAGMENNLGRLSAGFFADLTVVETDPFNCDPADLYYIRPIATMVGGDWVWRL